MSCKVNVNQIFTPPNTVIVQRQQDAGDPGSIVTTNIYITNDVLQKVAVVDVCRGTQGPAGPEGPQGEAGPPGADGVQFDVLPIVSGGTNNTSFNADYIIYYDGANDQLASTDYTIQDILNGVQALTGIVEGSGIQTTDLGSNQIRIDSIVGYGLDVDPVSNAIYLTGIGQIQPGQLDGILPINKGGTANTVYTDGKLIAYDSSALNGSGQFISATNLDVNDIVVSGDGFTLTAGSGLVNGGFVIIPNGTGRIDIPESADITVFADSFELSQTGTPGTYSKVTTDSKGRVTLGEQLSPADIYNILGYIPWHSGNDGCGSKLDADMLCGQSGDYYLDATNITGIISTGVLPDIMTEGRYTKVDVNTKGLVTSGMQMTPEDIENILGYDPVSPTGGVDFCGDVELHGSLFINKPTGCNATDGFLRVYDNLPMFARNNQDISAQEPRGFSFIYGGGLISRTGSLAYYPTDGEGLVKVTTNMFVNNNGVDGGDSDDEFTDDINGGDANSIFPISNLTGDQRTLLYRETADDLYVSRYIAQIVQGEKNFVDGITVGNQVKISGQTPPSVPPTDVGSNTLLNVNFNADLLDDQHGDYYLDAGNVTGDFDSNKVSFPYINGTPNYIPKFKDDGRPESNSIVNSIMYQSNSNNIVIKTNSSLVVGDQTNNFDVSSNRNNIMAGENHSFNNTSNSLIVGTGHNNPSNNTAESNAYLGRGGESTENLTVVHGDYGEGWVYGQISHGAFETRDTGNIRIEHGQATDFLMYLEGQQAVGWADLTPSVQLPDDHTIGFKVTLLMNSAFTTGVAEFEFLSGIVKNVTFRDPDNPIETITETVVAQQPKKHEIYNNSYIKIYDYSLLCTDLNELQYEQVKYDAPPIKVNDIVIENLPKTLDLQEEDPDGFYATYTKDNLGALTIDVDPPTFTGSYRINSEGDIVVYCNDHDLTVGTYTYLTFDSFSSIALPDQRYLVKSILSENEFTAEQQFWLAEKQSNGQNAVFTILPESLQEKDDPMSFDIDVQVFNKSGVRLINLDPPTSPTNWCDSKTYEYNKRALRNLTVDSNCILSDSPVVLREKGGDYDFTFNTGISGPTNTTLKYYDYSWEYFRKSEYIKVSGEGTVVQYSSPNTLTASLFASIVPPKYSNSGYTYNETYNYENAYAGALWIALNTLPSGLTIETNTSLPNIPDGSFVNIGAFVENSGAVRVRKRHKQSGTYQRISYNANKIIDCVYTRFENDDGHSLTRIIAKDYEDLGLLDRPYTFSLFDNDIGTNDNDKFKIVEDNDLYYLYTAQDMPSVPTNYDIEIKALDYYGTNEFIKKLNVTVSDTISLANDEAGLDNIVLVNGGVVATDTSAGEFITLISGVGGYDPLVVFEQGYNSFTGVFYSGNSLVRCEGVSQQFPAATLSGTPCGLCTGEYVLVDYNRSSIPSETFKIDEIYCSSGLQATPIYTKNRFVFQDPANSQDVIIGGQDFEVSGFDYTVGSLISSQADTQFYGFSSSTDIAESTEINSTQPNISWMNYTGLPSDAVSWTIGIGNGLFRPLYPESGLRLDVGNIDLEFDEPVNNLILWFTGISADVQQDGYILQEDSDKIFIEDGLGFIKNDSSFASSASIVSSESFVILDTNNPVSQPVSQVATIGGTDCDLVLCFTGLISGMTLSVLADPNTEYSLALGSLVPKTVDTSIDPWIRTEVAYTGWDNNPDNAIVSGYVLHTGNPIDSGNLPISGLEKAEMFFDCQNSSSGGVYGYETTPALDYDACYTTGECQVFSAKSTIDEDGDVQGQASYLITFDEDIYISTTRDSFIQLTDWTPTDSDPTRTIVPEQGYYPISVVTNITNNSFIIPEEYAVSLPIPGTGMSRVGTLSGSFDVYHPYKILADNIMNQVPAQFLDVQRIYNPAITDEEYRPKDNLFDIMAITGSTVYTEDKLNYLLIEEDRPPYLDQVVSGNYVTDSRDFHASISPYSNRLRDLSFDSDNVRDLNYADAAWSLKDIYVLADYDSANSRLTLYNIPTGIFKPLDTIQISFNQLSSINVGSDLNQCSLFPVYHDVPAEDMFLYTGVPITQPSGENIGNIIFTLSDTAPEGWVVLDGSTYDRTEYPALAQYLDFYRILYSSGWSLGTEGWAASTLPDLRKVTPVGQYDNPLTSFSNMGEIIRDTGNKLLLETNRSNDFGQSDNIVGKWIMSTEGNYYDPRYPINFSDSGTLNYVIENVDIQGLDGKTDNFITPYARLRIDILQFLEPDIRMNYAGGQDSPNYIYMQNSPTEGNGIIEPCVQQDINSCDFNDPYSDPYKVYTPINPIALKLRYDPNAEFDQRYSIVLRDKSDFVNYDEDIGVAHLFTKEIYDFDAGITSNAWWPEGILPLSGANDGPAKSPLIYTSGGGGIPDNEGTAQDWFVWEYDITPMPSEKIFFDNYAYEGQFGVWIRASGEGYGEDDNIAIRVTTIDEQGNRAVRTCTLMNDSPYTDGYVISNGNGGFSLYTVDAGDRLKIDWEGAICDTDWPPASPSGTGSLTLEVYGSSYQQGNGKPVIVQPPSLNHIRNDFRYERDRYTDISASTKRTRVVYQLPSVELRYNVCSNSDEDRIRWYTLPYKTSIDTFNVPRSYLEYGDEFKLTSINKSSNFSDTVTRTLTKINPTLETTSVSGLATSSDLCRFIPCIENDNYTKYRKTIMWGETANDTYPSVYDTPLVITGIFFSGQQQSIDFVDVFPNSVNPFTFDVDFHNYKGLPFTGCVFSCDDGMACDADINFCACVWQDKPNDEFTAYPYRPSFRVYMTECSGAVGFTISQGVGGVAFPKPWSDPLLTSAAYCAASYEQNSDSKTIDNFWLAPFESCNTGLYQDRPRSATPFGLNLKEDIGWTGICEFTKTTSGRMYIPENNNLYFHTYGGTTAHWPLDYKGSGTPTQQTGVYVIDSVPDFGSANTCSSGLMCIEISGYNNLEITGIPTFGDRENIGQSPIVIESNGVTGIVSNYGAIKQLFFDFDDGLPQLSNVYNVIDYTDGRKKIVINAPYDATVVNKSGLVFMIENDENIKTHLNPNVNNEFNVYDPQVTPPEIFDGQINHFDLNTRRWKHLCHYEFDAIGTGTYEVTVNLSGTQGSTDIYPIFPTGIELSGIRIAQSLSEGFADYQNGDSFLINNSTEDFYVQFVTLNGTPPYTDNAFVEIPKVSISGIQEYEFELDPLDGLTLYHGSGWIVCAKVNRTEEIIDQREITLRAEDITGKADIALSYSTSFLPEVIQSYTGYANFSESQWTLIYDTKFIDLSVLGTNVLEFELLGAPTTGPFSYSIPRDNVLVIQGNTDPSVTATTYYDVTLIAKTGIGSIPMATGTGLLVDIRQNSDNTPLNLTLNNFNNFGPRGTEGTFYLETETTGVIKFDIPQPQGDVVTQGGEPFEITYINQGDISNEMSYLISPIYNTQERRYNVTMTPTGVDNEYYNQTNRFANQQLKIVVPYRAWSDVDQSPIIPTPSTEGFPIFETILYTGLNIANSNPNTIQYYEKDEPWTIQVRVSGGVNQHDPTTRPNLRIFNTPNKGSYANNNNPIDCILNYRFQNQPGATYWIVDATARRDVLGNYMNQTGEFRLYVNADDGLTDYKTLNDADGINDQFVIIYNEPSGFVNLPPLLHSVPSAPFFTHCDVLSTNTGFEPTIVVRDNYGINLTSIDYRFDDDFPLWQRAYEGDQGNNFIWDAKVEISNNGLITASVKGLGDDKIQSVAKFETIEIESDQLDTVPFKIESVNPSQEESEQFPSETGIIVEQGEPWELQVTTVGGIADPRYPPTIILNDMPTPCTGFNPLDTELSTDQQCISSEPTFDGLRWTYSFSGQASCDLLGVLPFDILALDTLPGGNPLYPAADTFDGNFIYETGRFSVLGPEVAFTGETDLFPQCDICYTGYVDFGPKQQEDLDCNAVTGIKSISFSGELPSGLDYEIFFPTSTEGVPISRGKGTGTPPTVVFPAPWNNLGSGYIEITGCPTHFAEGGGSYLEEAMVIACNAVDDCEEITIIFEDASEPIPPNVDFSYFFLHPNMALSPSTGVGILGGGDANKTYAPAAQEYNLDCGTRLPINACRTYLMYFSGAGQFNGTFISGIYPEGQPNNNKIDLQNSPNNFVYVSGDYDTSSVLGPDRYVAIDKDGFNQNDTPGFTDDFDLFIAEGLAAGKTGLGFVVVEKTPDQAPKVDKLNLYFEDMPFDHGTNLCILGGGDITAGTIQGEEAKYGLTGQLIPKWSGQFVDDNSTFADDDEYMSGLNLVEINTDTDVPVLNTLTVNDCYSTGYMRISGIVLPPLHSEITDPPPVATAPFWTFTNLSLSLATRLSYGDTEVQRANPPNNRNDTLYWNAYDAVVNEKIDDGTVSSNGAFSFVTQKTSGVVYVISIENEADFAPSENYDIKGYSKNDYAWIHKGDIQKAAPTQTTFPPILPTGFEYLDVRFNTSTNINGYALGGYVIPDPNSKVLYQQNGVPAIPYWQDSNGDYSSSDYLPSISGMILTSIPLPEPLVATASVDRGGSTPLTGIIPVPDDYVGVGDRVDIKIAQSTQIWQEGSYLLTADNLTGTPVTGVVITRNDSYFGSSSPSGIITKKMEVVNINTTGVIIYHPDIDYTIGDTVTLETPRGTSSRYTACNDLDLIITDGNSSSMELSISTTDQSWYDGIVSVGDSVTINKQEEGELRIDNISSPDEGQYLYDVVGTPTTLYKDYIFRIVTCENASHPFYNNGLSTSPKVYNKEYNLYISKPISIVQSSISMSGTKTAWILRFNIEGGRRPVQNYSPRVMLKYATNLNGTFCGFTRTVVDRPPTSSVDRLQENRMIDEYDVANDQLIIELRGNSDYDWNSQSTITLVVSDETGSDEIPISLPSSN